MRVLDVYQILVELHDDPEAFEEKADEILEEYYSTLSPELSQQARQVRWALNAQLRKYKNPQARMNRMVEIFWEQFQQFQIALNNPSSVDLVKNIHESGD